MVDIGIYRSLGGLVSYQMSQSEIPTCPLWRIGNEQMLVEKLSSFVVHGSHNTRAKDLFDAAWIITNLKISRQQFRSAFGRILKGVWAFLSPQKKSPNGWFSSWGKKSSSRISLLLYGAPEPTRTADPQLRRLLLYPAELRAQEPH
jgi:hypothetical protein